VIVIGINTGGMVIRSLESVCTVMYSLYCVPNSGYGQFLLKCLQPVPFSINTSRRQPKILKCACN